MRRKSFLSNPRCIAPTVEPDKIHEVFALLKDVFYARPHLFPLPQERTLLRMLFKHLDAGRANTVDGELEVGRKTIHLLLGEKAGMRASVKPIGAQRRRYTYCTPTR
jgi:hypothetical protein